MAGAWTTPLTAVPGAVMTAAQWNASARDNLLWLDSLHGCSLYRTADTSTFATSTRFPVPWTAELYDTDTFHDNVTNNTRITIPTGLAGYYRFICQATWDSDNNNSRRIVIRKNGDNTAAGINGVGNVVSVVGAFSEQFVVDQFLNVGDYVEMVVWQNSGTNRFLQASITWDGTNAVTSTFLIAQWLGS